MTNEIPPIPITVLTGFLGSGKTTLLNRILTENHGQRIAVIENEFGEISIDHELVIAADEEVFTMNNGCICCSVRGDLIRIMTQLLKRRQRFDRILVETTGLADPGPVALTFMTDESLAQQVRLDGIVTVVDAHHIQQHLATGDESETQLAFADVIVLNKLDLVDPADLPALEGRIRQINSQAKLLPCERANVPIEEVLDIGGFDLGRMPEEYIQEAAPVPTSPAPVFSLGLSVVAAAPQRHQDDVTSVGLTLEGNLDPDRFHMWMGDLLLTKGTDLYRTKGILSIAGEDHRYVFQAVHMIFEGAAERPWGDLPRRSSLVFIGRYLDREALTAGFQACKADS